MTVVIDLKRHNNPPEPTPFEEVTSTLDELIEEGRNWADGEPIANADQAKEVGRLLDLLDGAMKRAEALRVEEKAPLDEAVKAVQARYAPYLADGKTATGSAVRVKKALAAAVAHWNAELQRQLDAEAARQREDADRLRREADDRVRAASQSSSVAEREAAETQLRSAKAAEADANRAARAKASVRGEDGARARGLRMKSVATVTDEFAFVSYLLAHHTDTLMDAARPIAQQLVNAKVREIPGVSITEVPV